MSTIAQVNNSSREQFHQLLDLFGKEFLPDVAGEITSLFTRCEMINELAKNIDPQLDRKARFILLIEKLKPNDLAKDIEKMVSFDHLFEEYQRFIKMLG